MAKSNLLILLLMLAACSSHAPKSDLTVERQPSAAPQTLFDGQYVPTYPLTSETEFAPQNGIYLGFTVNDTGGLDYAIFEKRIAKYGFFARMSGKQNQTRYYRKTAKINLCFENLKFDAKTLTSWALRVEISQIEDSKLQWNYHIQTFVLPPSVYASANRTISVIDWKAPDQIKSYPFLDDASQGRTTNAEGAGGQPYSSLFNLLSDAIKNRPNFIESHGLACK